MTSERTDNKTTQVRPRGQWVVFRSEIFWRSASAWSAVVFFLAFGASLIGWSYWVGDDSATATLIQRRLGFTKVESEKVKAESFGSGAALTTIAAEPKYRRAIDGMPRESSDASLRYYSVMIDNLDDARPQSGLSKAPLVIEAPVEGGVTRFLALFPEDVTVAKIGPVRSARPYYPDWAAEFDALYAHVGGSPEALDLIAQDGTRDLNEYYWGKDFWRDSARKAPHNAYTSTELLRRGFEERFPRRVANGADSWKFAEPQSHAAGAGADLIIDFSRPVYKMEWKYDAGRDAYVRYQGGVEQRDTDGTPITARNVAVEFTTVQVLDDVGRRRVATIGGGRAVVARAGTATEGTWKKDGRKGRTRFFGSDGQESVFTPGTTWIEVVPTGAAVSY